jgi:hypothetical protein
MLANSEANNVNIKIVAADINIPAMAVGYLTMKSYELEADKISWVQADVTKRTFFEWIRNSFHVDSRRKIITLIQPSSNERSFLDFLKQSSSLSREQCSPTTIVMPILLMEKNSEWYRQCNMFVERARAKTEKDHTSPQQLIWNTETYGDEMLKWNSVVSAYVPEQYFVRPEYIKKIQEITGFIDSSETIFPRTKDSCNANDPLLVDGVSKRKICIWDAKW